MNKRAEIVLIAIFFLFACNTKESGQYKLVEKSKYPHVVDSLGLTNLYDDVKWNLYLLECDDTPRNYYDQPIVSPPKSFGSLDLKFDSVTIKNDTVRFYFDFYNDTQVISRITHKDLTSEYFNGMMFYKGMDSFRKCWVTNYSNFSSLCFWVENAEDYSRVTDRTIKPLQPEVIEYINKNKATIHPWLYAEAKKRGVIKD